MSNQVMKVKRDAIAACMTCPLCHKLLREATTISECLHTFCRKCIYTKLSDEELECCPICQIDLGCVPLEKLRPDHNLQDVRAKIFPYKRLKVNAPEIMSSVTYPARQKERSLSSLVVNTPRVSTQGGLTGRRSKSIARKSLCGSGFSIEKLSKKEDDSAEDCPESFGSPETRNEFAQNLRQNSSSGEPSGRSIPDKEIKNGAEPWEANVDLWDPLNCLVEVANRSKSSKFLSQGSALKSESIHYTEKEGHTRKKFKPHGHRLKNQEKTNNNEAATLESGRLKKIRKVRPKKARAFGEFNVPPQTVLDGVSATRCKTRNYPIWFSLVASAEPDGEKSLPQISASYLRIKDGNITISFIQMYLMRKLGLQSVDQVEIRCTGQPLAPTMPLNEVVDTWLQTTPKERVSAIISTSAKDFVMVLAYGIRRKTTSST